MAGMTLVSAVGDRGGARGAAAASFAEARRFTRTVPGRFVVNGVKPGCEDTAPAPSLLLEFPIPLSTR